jgi:hypothetical protein
MLQMSAADPGVSAKGLFTQPAGDAVTPGFPLAVRRVIV